MHHSTDGSLADHLDPEANADAIAWLTAQSPSCHSDLGASMILAAADCGDCTAWSPSFVQCRYVAFITNRRVFAIGAGQRTAYYRVPRDMVAVASESGGTAAVIGSDWVRFELWRVDRPAPDLRFWTLFAYVAARATATAR